jgi:hypothetical protein
MQAWRCSLLLAIGLWQLPGMVRAAPGAESPAVSPEVDVRGQAWPPVEQAALERCRGGFTNASGLEFSLGIDRFVTINGDVVAHTTLQIGDVRALTTEQAQAFRDSLSTGGIIQNGANNSYFGSLDSAAAGTLVQNSLNDQTIRTQTIINSTVNSLSLLKDLNFQATLRDAAIGAIGLK